MYNFVSNLGFKTDLKKSKYFKLSLGVSSTKIDRTGERVLNQEDEFAYFWNDKYKTPIYKQGSIGDILFYTDHYMPQDDIYVITNNEVTIIKIDRILIRDKGIDFYLGHIIKNIETESKEKSMLTKPTHNQVNNVGTKPNPDTIIKSPGSVKYEDLKAYIEKKREERFL